MKQKLVPGGGFSGEAASGSVWLNVEAGGSGQVFFPDLLGSSEDLLLPELLQRDDVFFVFFLLYLNNLASLACI